MEASGVRRLFCIFLHKASQILHVLDRRLRQNAMTEIENVSRPAPGAPQNSLGARLQFCPAGEEQNRIQIALHGAAKFQAAPALVKQNAPVEPDHFRSGFFHGRKKSGGIRAPKKIMRLVAASYPPPDLVNSPPLT